MELLISSRAGLKEVPWLAKRVAILNQLDVSSVTEERVAAFTKALTDIGYRCLVRKLKTISTDR